jgi:hypothetical protein
MSLPPPVPPTARPRKTQSWNAVPSFILRKSSAWPSPALPPTRRLSAAEEALVDVAALELAINDVDASLKSLAGDIERAAEAARDAHEQVSSHFVSILALVGALFALFTAATLWSAPLAVQTLLPCFLLALAGMKLARDRLPSLAPASPLLDAAKALKAHVQKAKSILKHGQDQQDEEAAWLSKRRFPAWKRFPVEGMRLNSFAGVANLDFAQHVRAKLPAREQAAFDSFSAAFDAEMKKHMHRLDAARFYQLPDDFTKLKFLQADQYKQDLAVVRLITTVVWRQTSGLDDFISNPDWELLGRYRDIRQRRVVGFDKANRPFMVERLGEFFGSDVVRDALSMDQYLMCYAFDISELTGAMREAYELFGGPYQHRVGYLGDVRGLRFVQTMRLIPFLKALTKQVDTHFPEMAGPLYLLNAPTVASKLWPVVKVFLDPNTASKIVIDSSDAREKVLEIFGDVVVPKEWGGLHEYELGHVPGGG